MLEDIIGEFLKIENYRRRGNTETLQKNIFFDILSKEQASLRRKVLATDDIEERERVIQEFRDEIVGIFKLAFESMHFYINKIEPTLPSGYHVRFGHYFTKYMRCENLFKMSKDSIVYTITDKLPESVCERYGIDKNFDFVKSVVLCYWPVVIVELPELPVGSYDVIGEHRTVGEECYYGYKDKVGMQVIRRDGEMDRVVICFVHFSKDEVNLFSMSPDGKTLRNYRWTGHT